MKESPSALNGFGSRQEDDDEDEVVEEDVVDETYDN